MGRYICWGRPQTFVRCEELPTAPCTLPGYGIRSRNITSCQAMIPNLCLLPRSSAWALDSVPTAYQTFPSGCPQGTLKTFVSKFFHFCVTHTLCQKPSFFSHFPSQKPVKSSFPLPSFIKVSLTNKNCIYLWCAQGWPRERIHSWVLSH